MDDIADQIETVRFTMVKLREGYDMEAVDDFLARLAVEARAGAPLAPLVDAARFPPVRFRAGYDMGQVDDFLTRVSSSTPSPQTASPTPPVPRKEEQGGAEGYNAIRKVRGPLERLRDRFRS